MNATVWKIGLTILLVMISQVMFAQLQFIPEAHEQSVFGSGTRSILLTWHNAGEKPEEADIHAKLVQATSSTAVLIGEEFWKSLRVLPGQTIVETAEITFPSVRGETRFLVQWMEKTNRVLGFSDILVYPTNLLRELRLLSADCSLGVFDPSNQLKPLLKTQGIDLVDLENVSLTDFQGKLAVIIPSVTAQRSVLLAQIKKVIEKGVAIVYVQPCHANDRQLQPSYYSVLGNKAASVIVQPDMVANLSERPQSQLNLIHFCQLARNPDLPALPDFSPQP